MPRQSMNGVRVHLQFTKPQYEKMTQYSKESGLPISELMRRAVDVYIHQMDKAKK